MPHIYNQEYQQYAHAYGVDIEEVNTSGNTDLVNINGQLVSVLADIR